MSGFVYLIGVVDQCHKIGKSKDPAERMKEFNTPNKLELVHKIETESPSWLEVTLHEAFAHCRVRGEWFRMAAEEVAFFKALEGINCEEQLPEIVNALRYRNRLFHPKRFAKKKLPDIFTQEEFTIDEAAFLEGLSVPAYIRMIREVHNDETFEMLTKPIIKAHEITHGHVTAKVAYRVHTALQTAQKAG